MVPRLEQELQTAMGKRDFVRCQQISDASDVGSFVLVDAAEVGPFWKFCD